jgi:hypothetical protein
MTRDPAKRALVEATTSGTAETLPPPDRISGQRLGALATAPAFRKWNERPNKSVIVRRERRATQNV